MIQELSIECDFSPVTFVNMLAGWLTRQAVYANARWSGPHDAEARLRVWDIDPDQVGIGPRPGVPWCEVTVLQAPRGLVLTHAGDPAVWAKVEGLLATLGYLSAKAAPETQAETMLVRELDPIPIPEEKGATWDDLFDWWYRGGKLQYPTLAKLSASVGRSRGHVHNKHSEYAKQYGKAPRPRP